MSDGPATVLRTGLDLVTVADVASAIGTHGDRYLDRVFTAGERRDCTGPDGAVAVERLAARFAAKEAAIKVLRPDRDTSVPWTDIEVVRDEAGWPVLRWRGRAARLAELRGVSEVAISITHERETAACVVVARVLAAPPN